MQAKVLTPSRAAKRLKRIGKPSPKTAREAWSLQLYLTRVVHIVKPVASEYSKISFHKYGRHHSTIPERWTALLQKAKNLDYLLEILETCEAEGCPVSDFLRAQFEILAYTGHKPFLTVCRGPNAVRRYHEWKQKHKQKFRRNHERQEDLRSSPFRKIRKSILAGHKQALEWVPSIAYLKPPSLAAALFLGYPQISVWYLIAVDETRVLMPRVLDLSSRAEKHLKAWEQNSALQELCKHALQDAITQFGKVEL